MTLFEGETANPYANLYLAQKAAEAKTEETEWNLIAQFNCKLEAIGEIIRFQKYAIAALAIVVLAVTLHFGGVF